ncbi:MAG: hypothetical protein RMM07_09585, partial [Anaerolineae bacterium]|nr:hypothetical protein [Anaerolineae bacterium]
YWAEAFARHGFFRDVDFDASFITPWAMRLRRCREPMHRIVRHYERRYWTLWQENLELRALALELRERVAAQEQEIHRLRSLEDQASPRNNLGACKVLRGIVRWLRGRGK